MHIFYAKKLGRAWHRADCSLNEWAESTTFVNPGVRLSPSSREKNQTWAVLHIIQRSTPSFQAELEYWEAKQI